MSPVVPGFTARAGAVTVIRCCGRSHPGRCRSTRPCLPAHRRLAPTDVTGPTPDRVAYTRDGTPRSRVQPPPAAGAVFAHGTSATPRCRRRQQCRCLCCPRRSCRRRCPLQARRLSCKRCRWPRRHPEPPAVGAPPAVVLEPAAAAGAALELHFATGSAGTLATAGQAFTTTGGSTPAPTPTAPGPGAGTPTSRYRPVPSTVTPAPNLGSSGTPLTAPTTTCRSPPRAWVEPFQAETRSPRAAAGRPAPNLWLRQTLKWCCRIPGGARSVARRSASNSMVRNCWCSVAPAALLRDGSRSSTVTGSASPARRTHSGGPTRRAIPVNAARACPNLVAAAVQLVCADDRRDSAERATTFGELVVYAPGPSHARHGLLDGSASHRDRPHADVTPSTAPARAETNYTA